MIGLRTLYGSGLQANVERFLERNVRDRLTPTRLGVLLTVAAVAIRIWISGRLYLNPDEALHLNVATSRHWNAVHHPPLLLWWLWLISQVSEKEWWLRLLPSVAGGLAPVAAVFWLRRWASSTTAWSAAVLLAFAPLLVYLTIQVRGYAFAILAILIALGTLERAFENDSIVALLQHFGALYIAIFSDFSSAFIVLAISIYGIIQLRRTVLPRPFVLVWFAGEITAAGLYLWLFLTIVWPLLHSTPHAEVAYLDPFLPGQGESLLGFVSRGFYSQFVYITGGLWLGFFAAILFLIGSVAWIRRGDLRAVLLVVPFLATIAAACARVFSFGATRHTVLIGLIGLAGASVGIEVVSMRLHWFRMSVPLVTLALLVLATPFDDSMNIPLERANKIGWDNALQQLRAVVPAGSIVVTTNPVFEMLVAARLGQTERSDSPSLVFPPEVSAPTDIDDLHILRVGQSSTALESSRTEDGVRERVEELRGGNSSATDTIWLLDGGWNLDHFPGGFTVIDGPEIHLARIPWRM